jgi:hypothetical protein
LLSIEIPQREVIYAREISGSCSKLPSFSSFNGERMQELSTCASRIIDS